MRGILFRGKMVYEMPKPFSEWIRGYLCFVYTDNPLKARIYNTSTAKSYDVLTETVGQFTGLYDNNGIKIFEGDIVFINGAEKGTIVWDSEKLEYRVNMEDVQIKLGLLYSRDLKVIGTIHDKAGD